MKFREIMGSRVFSFIAKGYRFEPDAEVAKVIVHEGCLTLRTDINISEFPPMVSFPVGAVFVVCEVEL